MLYIQQLFPTAHLLSAWGGQLLSLFPWTLFLSSHLLENLLEFQAVYPENIFLKIILSSTQVPCSGKLLSCLRLGGLGLALLYPSGILRQILTLSSRAESLLQTGIVCSQVKNENSKISTCLAPN